MLLKDSESCVINGGNTAKYFPLQGKVQQGNPISAHLFILALDVLFDLIKSKKDVSGLNIFGREFRYTAYAGLAFCGMKLVNLMKYSIKILGVHISCSRKLQDNVNFQVAIKILPLFLKFGKWEIFH